MHDESKIFCCRAGGLDCVRYRHCQVAGGDGIFGTTYTLNNGFNFQIIGAKYRVEPFNAYETEMAKPDEQILVLTVSIKNANPPFFEVPKNAKLKSLA